MHAVAYAGCACWESVGMGGWARGVVLTGSCWWWWSSSSCTRRLQPRPTMLRVVLLSTRSSQSIVSTAAGGLVYNAVVSAGCA